MGNEVATIDQSRESKASVETRHPMTSDLTSAPTSVVYGVAKRLFDLAGSIALLLVLSPVLLVIALAVKLSSRGPIVYKSTRVGFCGEYFTFYKFRSMRTDADKMLEKLMAQNEKDGPIFKMKNDPRCTPVGVFLRKYSLDELPQLWSVVTGHMSLVGPRPMLPKEVSCYSPNDFERLRVRPGITCYWQVMGRSRLTFEEWMELDRRYVRERSFWVDLKILSRTLRAVFQSDGAY